MRTSLRIDRRMFLGGAGLLAGAAVATTLVPLSVVHASTASLSVAAAGPAATASTWHVDDVCGHWPPYAYPIGYGQGQVSETLAQAEPIDHIFLA